MKINKIDTNHLRNDAHFQFHTEIIKLIDETGTETLKIIAQWPGHLGLLENLDTALKKITKSATTEKIHGADKKRDELYSGFVKFLAGLCEHYDPTMRDAALKVQFIVHNYGNVATKPLNEETSAIYNLVYELKNNKYKDIIAQLGLTQWVAKIELQNVICATLIQERDRENASKSHTAVKEARQVIDESYRHIIETINALLFLKQLTGCEAFVDTMNEIIHRFSIKHHRHKHVAMGKDGIVE